MKSSRIKTLCFCILHSAFCLSALAQSTAFTYQGRLNDGATLANGSYDFRFGLFPTAGAGLQIAALTNSGVAVSNGLFTTTLDFGSGVFGPSSQSWLEIGVRSNGAASPFGILSPRQQITPAPYAIRAANFSGAVTTSQLPANVVTNGGTNFNIGGKFTGTFSGSSTGAFTGSFTGNGGGLTNLNLTTLGGRTADDFWQLDGNNVGLGQILGSTNNQVVQFVANGFNALRLEPNSMASPNLVGGNGNSISPGVYAAVIGGGFANNIQTNASAAAIAGGEFNNIGPGANDSAINGGYGNRIQTNASYSTIGGGQSQIIDVNSSLSFIGGGLLNGMQGNNTFSFIGGGYENTFLSGASYGVIGGGKSNTNAASTAVIAGGEGNTVQALADRSFIGGGLRNFTTGANGMVPGGFANSAGSYAFAAGRRAKANDTGSFVWADTFDADFASFGINTVSMRASGGYRLYSNTSGAGVSLATGGTSWGALCDRNAKKNFAPADGRDILEKLAGLPVQRWNYRWETDDAVQNLGPMAQDFKAAFYPGRDDKVITTLEFDGVELAAIQGLNQKLEQTVKQQDAEIHELKQRLGALENLMRNQKSN